MVTLFGLVGIFALAAVAVGCIRAVRAFGNSAVRPFGAFVAPGLSGPASGGAESPALRSIGSGLRDALTLRHLHGSGADCTGAVDVRSPWRRWFHHLTLYGFLLCFASTSVAALYHIVFGWRAPYGYASLPVVLGTAGGAGLIVGPAGLFALRRRRDEALADPAQAGLDDAFILMLFMTSATGLLLLALRGEPMMPLLVIVHLGFVLGLFLALPYGKFVHGVYRTAALITSAQERRRRG